MRKIFYTLAIAVCAMSLTSCNSCSSNKTNEGAEAAAASEDDGWVTIFDGTSFDGWRGYCMETVPVKWTLEGDGSMKINTPNNGKEGQEGGGNLIWGEKLKNFEFEIEWKSPEKGNSGIFYLAQEIPGRPIYTSCPEYQLGSVDGSGTVTKHGPASLFDILPADPQNAKVPGEWNKAKIVVKDGHVQHWQNDVLVCEYDFTGPEWIDMLNSSKFSEKDWPEAFNLQKNLGGDNHEGYIGLQDHGLDFWFRNARLKKLD